MIVLDANILVRAVLGRRVRQLIERYSVQGVRFAAPDEAFRDAERYLPSIIEKRNPGIDVPAAFRYLRQKLEILDAEVYSSFEQEAHRRLKGRDEENWPVLACALALGCAVWTEDTDFFGTGIAVWTTNRIDIFLESQVQASQDEQE